MNAQPDLATARDDMEKALRGIHGIAQVLRSMGGAEIEEGAIEYLAEHLADL
jgi:hypothetical protein